MALLAAWPLSAWLAVATLLLPAVAWPANRLWQWCMRRSDRSDQLEDHAIELVELLRAALDKGRIRENGLASACDILTFAIEHLPEPQPMMIEIARLRALEHLHAARDACLQIDRATK